MEITVEREVKLACDDIDRLRKAGFHLRLIRPRHFEDNWLLDWPGDSLWREGSALRVRSSEGKGLVTFKGLIRESSTSQLKVREELEADTGEPHRMVEILERLGMRRVFRYQKYRTVYELELAGEKLEVVFDETPMGNFIEIEGGEASLLRVIEAAGFSPGQLIRESYPELQALRCKERGLPLEDLLFRGSQAGLSECQPESPDPFTVRCEE